MIKNDVIEACYQGHLQETPITDEEYKRLNDKWYRLLNELTACLPEDRYPLVNQIADLCGDITAYECRVAYRAGFETGAKFIMGLTKADNK